MGYRKNIMIRFLIILVVGCFVLGSFSLRHAMTVNNAERNVYNEKLSEICSLESTWKRGQVCMPAPERRTCPLEDVYSYSADLFKSIQPVRVLHGAVPKHSTFWQSPLARHQTSFSENSHQTSLKDIFQSVILLLLLINVRATILDAVACYGSKNCSKECISSSIKKVVIDLPSLLGRVVSKSVGGFGEKGSKEEALNLKDGKTFPWMYGPMRRAIASTEYIIFSVLDRVASFRLFSSTNESNNISALTLAEAGFKYTGVGSIVECQECGSSVDTSEITSPAVEAKYHRDRCSYIQDDHEVSINSHTGNHGVGDHHGNQEARPPNSNQHGNQEVRPTNSNHHGNQEARPTNSNQHGNQEARPANSNQHGNQEARPTNSNHHGIQEGQTFTMKHHGNQEARPSNICLQGKQNFQGSNSQEIVTDSTEPESERITLNEQAACIEPLPASNIATCSISVQQQQPPQATLSVQQQPTQAITSVQQKTNQAAALIQQQTNTTTVQGQTNEAVINPELMGACAAPVGAGHLGTEDTSNYNDSLFDMDEFAPEHHICDNVKEDHRATCIKNPGHFGNIPIRQLQEDHMPASIRDPAFLELISLVAKLTVKVLVSVTSEGRPNPGTDATVKRCGTGMAITQTAEKDQPINTHQSGKWNGLKKLLRKNKGYIYIQTNRHLVYDDYEAENTIVEFFYDSSNRKDVIIAKGVSIEHSQTLGDFKSILKCRISDLSMVEFVVNTENKIKALANGFPERLKKELIKRVFVISHPHGHEKMFTFGEYVVVKYALKMGIKDEKPRPKLVKINNHTQISQNPNEIRKVLLYTADTCEGSSGAVVILFKKKKNDNNTEEIVYDTWMHTGLCRKHGLNASVMKVLTEDDIANHGTTEIFRPSIQEVQEAEADNAANQVVSCPVFVVFGASTHPAYAVYRKRLDSFPDEFIHVHSIRDLADAGFFYAGYADCVRCFHCGLGLRSWMAGDGIFEEHYRNRPDCQFLQMKMKASGIDPVSLQAPEDQRTHTQAQPQTNSANTENGDVRYQQPNLTTQQQQRCLEMDSLQQTQLMKHVTDLVVPNRQQEVVVGMVSGSTVQNNGVSRALEATVMSVLEKEQQYLKQLLTCKICLTNQVKDLFLPCGELIACIECSKLLTHCPSCNKKILATVTTFFS